MITTADYAYFVAADGYMSGEIVAKMNINTQLNQNEEFGREFIYADTCTETPDSWSEALWSDRGGNDGDHAGNGYTRETGRSDVLDGGESESNPLGDYWENYGYHSFDEFLDAISAGAMAMDDNGQLIEAPDYNEQLQRRNGTLTDRDMLVIALSTTDMY